MSPFTIHDLEARVHERAAASAETSYTRKLLDKGIAHCAKKLGEEAVELALASVIESRERLIDELSERDQAKSEQRGKKRGNDNFPVREIQAHSPGYEQESRTGFQDGARPVFDCAVGKNAKGDEGTYSNAQKLHGRGFPAVSGIRATSSTQALP